MVADGAAAVLVMDAGVASELGIEPLGRIAGYAWAGCEPRRMGLGPCYATPPALAEAGIGLGQVDLVELNEAFAVQACAVTKELKLDPAKVNVNGGAVALGHPIGASGARVLTTLLYALKDRNAKRGIAALCLGGGNGVAMAVELV